MKWHVNVRQVLRNQATGFQGSIQTIGYITWMSFKRNVQKDNKSIDQLELNVVANFTEL